VRGGRHGELDTVGGGVEQKRERVRTFVAKYERHAAGIWVAPVSVGELPAIGAQDPKPVRGWFGGRLSVQ